jgi:hypothetical protein
MARSSNRSLDFSSGSAAAIGPEHADSSGVERPIDASLGHGAGRAKRKPCGGARDFAIGRQNRKKPRIARERQGWRRRFGERQESAGSKRLERRIATELSPPRSQATST